MMTLKHWLNQTFLEAEDFSTRPWLLKLISKFFIISCALIFIFRVILQTDQINEFIMFYFSAIGSSLVVLYLVSIKKIRLATTFFIMFLWIIVSVGVWVEQGVGGVAFSSYWVVILLAGLISNTRLSLLVTFLTFVYGYFMLQLEVNGVILGSQTDTYSIFYSYLPILLILPIIVYFIQGSLRQLTQTKIQKDAVQLKAGELIHQTNQLEVEVEQKTKELEEAILREQSLALQLKRALHNERELSQLKSNIIDTVSHEFRTPLAIIQNSSDLIYTIHANLSEDKRKLYHKRIRDQVFYLNGLLENVEYVSQPEAEKTSAIPIIVPFNTFCSQLERSFSEVLFSYEFLSFEYDTEETAVILIDNTAVQHILYNLLDNAKKYSLNQTPIVTKISRNGANITFEIRDQGIGIVKGEEEKIFELFQRGSNINTQRGLGIGLSIVHKIVGSLDGTIRVENNKNEGSTFIVTLPVELQE